MRQALARSGYRVEQETKDFDLPQIIAKIAAETRGQTYFGKYNAERDVRAVGPAGEQLEIYSAQWPAGPRVAQITFYGDPGRQTMETFKTQVLGKFGTPTARAADAGRWCDPEQKICGALDTMTKPTLEASWYKRGLTLSTSPASCS